MLTHVVEFTPEQLQAVRCALDDRAQALMKAARESMDSDFLTAAQVRDQVGVDLRLMRPTLAALTNVDPVAADQRLTELGSLMGDYHGVLAHREKDEAEVAAWNARVGANERTASDSGSESGLGARSLGAVSHPYFSTRGVCK